MKTGNTPDRCESMTELIRASMEPGHEDREYQDKTNEPHHHPRRLNGARS